MATQPTWDFFLRFGFCHIGCSVDAGLSGLLLWGLLCSGFLGVVCLRYSVVCWSLCSGVTGVPFLSSVLSVVPVCLSSFEWHGCSQLISDFVVHPAAGLQLPLVLGGFLSAFVLWFVVLKVKPRARQAPTAASHQLSHHFCGAAILHPDRVT